jgi:integrase
VTAAGLTPTKWIPAHKQELEGFWLRVRNNTYLVDFRDPLTRKMTTRTVGKEYMEAYQTTKRLACRVRLGKPPTPKRATVWEVIDDWFARELVPPRYKPTTIANYKYHVERFILPTLAERRFADIDTMMWDNFFSRIEEFDTADPKRKRNAGVTSEQVNTVKKVVKSLCRWAQANGYSTDNNAARVRMTTIEHRERETLTPAQFEFVLGFVDEYYRVHLATLFYGGIRGCELAALPWREVTFQPDGTVDVRITQSLSRRTIGTPKTKGPARLITLPPHVADLLREHQGLQGATQLPHRDDLVFTTRQGKTTNLQNLRARVLYPALDRANAYLAAEGRPALPKIVLHGLRHSNITTLRSLGVAGISVQKHAGHGSERMTDHYTHLDERRRIAQLLDTAHRAAVSAPEPAAGVMRALGGHTCGFSGGDHGCLEWPPAGIVPPTRATLFVCMVATRWGSRPDTK